MRVGILVCGGGSGQALGRMAATKGGGEGREGERVAGGVESTHRKYPPSAKLISEA